MYRCANALERFDVCLKVIRKLCTAEIRFSKENYYTTLKLQQNCTAKDIRNAFLKLSKEFHPDKNQNDPKTHMRFVQLNEAYSVLSRPQKRNEYDQSLVSNHRIHPAHNYTPNSSNYTYASEQSFWKPEYSHTAEDVKGKKNISKSWVVFLCIVFTSVGVGLQVLAIRKSLTFSRDKLDQLSEANGRVLADVRKRANENGNEMQLEIIRQHIEDSVNEHNLHRKEDNKLC